MKKYWSLFLTVAIMALNSCSDDSSGIEPEVQGTEITRFSFLKSNNPNLDKDRYATIENDLIQGRLPLGVNVEKMVASFDHTGEEVKVNNANQVSGESINDFTEIQYYTVSTKDGKSGQYEVDMTYFTGLPIIYIETDNNQEINSKEDYFEGTISIDGGRYFSDFSSASMKIRGRGNSTWMHPKKPFQMKFPEKTEMLGMPEDKKWVFLAEFSDKTLIRNTIAFEMGYLSDLDYTPESVFAEVVINGVYNGTYNIAQKVEESDHRVVLGDTGYLLEIDQLERLDPDDVYFRTDRFLINIKEPETEYNSDTYNYARDLINEFEDVLMGPGFADPESGYVKYIDMDSFIDWYLISEIVKNQDSRSFSSIFLNVIPGEKIKMGPLWDFDLAFGNVDYSECEHPTGFWVKDHDWYARLFEDPVFVEKVKSRFQYYRENQNFILDKMDFYATQLKWSQYENDEKWDLFGRYVWPNPVVYDSHQAEVAHLKAWYKERMDWLDAAYSAM
ncbi:CotH kinase family protein [Lutimonas zeaxanthinifaciens]|uniref:CotH kinase family protein n=1 Tax=Lutimonas zeaxanthinifaciens TaxID=3060215 RepID=UPI00265D576D|nr:CotH kinase family protein [Lutimonas sp. YSD2104]WKK65115.1 CotH kinase family protein [Lutimonas sp. YSD2104]